MGLLFQSMRENMSKYPLIEFKCWIDSEYTVYFHILKQDDCIREFLSNKDFNYKNLVVRSHAIPELFMYTIYLRGSMKEADNTIAEHFCGTMEEAILYKNNLVEAIRFLVNSIIEKDG